MKMNMVLHGAPKKARCSKSFGVYYVVNLPKSGESRTPRPPSSVTTGPYSGLMQMLALCRYRMRAKNFERFVLVRVASNFSWILILILHTFLE